ncbi:hypothetical protein GGF44_004581, partial [Coemansia sp. RSA 1694]
MGDAAEEVEDDHSIDEAERSLVHYHQPHGMASPRVLEAGSDALALALPDNLAMEWLGGYPRIVEIASEMGCVEPLQLKSRHIAGLLEAPENAPIVEFPGSPRRIEARPDDEEGASLDELYPIIEVLDDEAAAPDAAGNPLIELPSTAIKRRIDERRRRHQVVPDTYNVMPRSTLLQHTCTETYFATFSALPTDYAAT